MKPTEKLYYSNPAQGSCTAVVWSCEKKGDTYETVTDRTCFFPEGGGQPADRGYIDDVEITDVKERDGVLYHISQDPLTEGATVQMTVDMVRREDHCTQHTGEHMLSGLAKSLFGAQNVGFHMADTYSTLDLDMMLTDEQIVQLEDAANAKVRENRRIFCEMTDAQTLSTLTLRKKTEGLEKRADIFRIVYIDGVDSCTCCGSHCERTGEVGIIKITSWQKCKSGIRIWFLCGGRALSDYREKQSIVDSIANRFSTSAGEALKCVVRQGDECADLKAALKRKTAQICDLRAQKLLSETEHVCGVKAIVLCDETADEQEQKILAEKLTESDKVIVVIMGYSDGSVQYTVGVTPGLKLTAGEVCKTVNMLINGKGGGRDTFARGRGAAHSFTAMRETAEQLLGYIRSVLRS